MNLKKKEKILRQLIRRKKDQYNWMRLRLKIKNKINLKMSLKRMRSN